MRIPRSVPSLLLLLLIPLGGCSRPSSPTAPAASSSAAFRVTEGQPAISAALSARSGVYRRIWPHEDGRGWTYDLTTRTWDGSPSPMPSPGDLPTLTLDDVAGLLETPIDPAGSTLESGTYRLRFNGLVTTMSGVTRQNLEETVESSSARAASLASPGSARPEHALLPLLRRARPDLARKLGLAAPALMTSAAANPFAPILLHGYAWEQTDQWIGTYGDLNQQIAWIFLTPDLKPGAEFSLQLVPDLADDVFLHGRVLGWESVPTQAGTFHHALQVAYLVDFGVSQATDADGNVIGYVHGYLYGKTDYAPGVGPVYSIERFLPGGTGPLTSEVVSDLQSTGSPLP